LAGNHARAALSCLRWRRIVDISCINLPISKQCRRIFALFCQFLKLGEIVQFWSHSGHDNQVTEAQLPLLPVLKISVFGGIADRLGGFQEEPKGIQQELCAARSASGWHDNMDE
jgi:hypothetical protein